MRALLWRSVFSSLQVLSAFGWGFLVESRVKTNLEVAKVGGGVSGETQNACDA